MERKYRKHFYFNHPEMLISKDLPFSIGKFAQMHSPTLELIANPLNSKDL